MNYDRHLDKYHVEGRTACGGSGPYEDKWVDGLGECKAIVWKRAKSGRGTLYLYPDKTHFAYPQKPDSQLAFGWIPEHQAQEIWLGTQTHQAESWGYGVYFPNTKKVVLYQQNCNFLTTDFSKQRNLRWNEKLKDKPQTEVKESETMTNTSYPAGKIESAVKDVVSKNKDAAVQAAYLEAGNIANTQLAKLTSKMLPLVLRGYADTPLGMVVSANIATLALEKLRPDQRQLKKLSEAMVVAAYQELIKTVNIDGMIEEFLSSKDVKAAMRKLGADEQTST